MSALKLCRNSGCYLRDYVIDPHGITNCLACGEPLKDHSDEIGKLFGDLFGVRFPR